MATLPTPPDPYKAVKVPLNEVHGAWALARPFIVRARECRVATGESYLEDVYVKLILGKAVLWLAYCEADVVGAWITQDVAYERGAVVQIPYMAGDGAEDWIHLLEDVLADAARRGFAEIELLSREGFGKALADYGCEKKWTLFRLKTGRAD